jgi:hypothetical protein
VYYIVVLIVGLIGGLYVGNMLLPPRMLKKKPREDDEAADSSDLERRVTAIEKSLNGLGKRTLRK